MSTNFLILTITSAICGVVFTLMITSYLSKHGIKINYWLLRLYLPKYIHQYRKITMEENGRPGNLFYAFIVSMNLALVLAVIAAMILSISGINFSFV